MSTTDHTGSGAVSGQAVTSDAAKGVHTFSLPLASQPAPVRASVEGADDRPKDVLWAKLEDLRHLLFGKYRGKFWYADDESFNLTLTHAEARSLLSAAPRSDRPLTGTPDAGGDLGELARLSEAEERYRAEALASHNFTSHDLNVSRLQFERAAVNYVRKILSASSSPAAAGGADREAVARIIFAGWLRFMGNGSDDFHAPAFSNVRDRSLGLADQILALTPRPAGPGAQAQSPDLGVEAARIIFVIGRTTGEYSDRREEVIAATLDGDLAERWAEETQRICQQIAEETNRRCKDTRREEREAIHAAAQARCPDPDFEPWGFHAEDVRYWVREIALGLPAPPALHPLNPAEAPTPESEVRTVSRSSVGREG